MCWSVVSAMVWIQLWFDVPCEYEGPHLRRDPYWFCESCAHPVEWTFQYWLYDASFEPVSPVQSQRVLRDHSDAFQHRAGGSFWRGRWGAMRQVGLRLASASVVHDSVCWDLGYCPPWDCAKEVRVRSATECCFGA